MPEGDHGHGLPADSGETSVTRPLPACRCRRGSSATSMTALAVIKPFPFRSKRKSPARSCEALERLLCGTGILPVFGPQGRKDLRL